jgi:hypothetical protein
MIPYLLNQLLSKNLISAEQHTAFSRYELTKPLALNWEMKVLLYFGVLFFSGGLGLLIYKNIDTFGHLSVIVLIALVTFLCFYYAYRNHPSFSIQSAAPTSAWVAYVLLLGCLTFLILEGYLQFQYQIFGTRYGLATFLPAVVFFFLAYYFDHRGVLSMAMTALISWAGVSVTPLEMLDGNDFSEQSLIYTALALGAGLVAMGWFLDGKGIKKHFTFTYLQFGGNLLFMATLAGLFTLDSQRVIFALLLAALSYSFITYARRGQSFWFMLIAMIYGYIGLTYLIFRLDAIDDFFFAMVYFIISCAGVIYFFLNHKKWMISNESSLPPKE